MKKLNVVLLIPATLALTYTQCSAVSPDEAVTIAVGTPGHDPQRAETDIAGDGFIVTPVKVQDQGPRSLRVTGEILHTYNWFSATEIKYDVTINSDGTVSGTLTIPKPSNPNKAVITNNLNGRVRGSVDNVQRDILPGQSKMDNAMILIQKVLRREQAKLQ